MHQGVLPIQCEVEGAASEVTGRARSFPSPSALRRYLERFDEPGQEQARARALEAGVKAFIPAPNEQLRGLMARRCIATSTSPRTSRSTCGGPSTSSWCARSASCRTRRRGRAFSAPVSDCDKSAGPQIPQDLLATAVSDHAQLGEEASGEARIAIPVEQTGRYTIRGLKGMGGQAKSTLWPSPTGAVGSTAISSPRT